MSCSDSYGVTQRSPGNKASPNERLIRNEYVKEKLEQDPEAARAEQGIKALLNYCFGIEHRREKPKSYQKTSVIQIRLDIWSY